jgi:methionine aminopeptidase
VLLTGLDNGFAADTVFTVSASNKTITDAVDAVNAAERQLEAARRNLVASR